MKKIICFVVVFFFSVSAYCKERYNIQFCNTLSDDISFSAKSEYDVMIGIADENDIYDESKMGYFEFNIPAGECIYGLFQTEKDNYNLPVVFNSMDNSLFDYNFDIRLSYFTKHRYAFYGKSFENKSDKKYSINAYNYRAKKDKGTFSKDNPELKFETDTGHARLGLRFTFEENNNNLYVAPKN